jgi:hypothetical protein
VTYQKTVASEINITNVELHQLTHAQTAVVKSLKHRMVQRIRVGIGFKTRKCCDERCDVDRPWEPPGRSATWFHQRQTDPVKT